MGLLDSALGHQNHLKLAYPQKYRLLLGDFYSYPLLLAELN